MSLGKLPGRFGLRAASQRALIGSFAAEFGRSDGHTFFPSSLMPQPILSTGPNVSNSGERFSATGTSLAIREWRGSGPAKLHVHHADDEAWHVLEGTLRFRFADRVVDARPGTTVFVPAGVAHTYEAIDARYLVFLTPRLVALIDALQQARDASTHAQIYRTYESELLE